MSQAVLLNQLAQLENPDSRIILGVSSGGQLLEVRAKCFAGILNGDSPKFQRQFWEILERKDLWVFQQSTVDSTCEYGGREKLILYDEAGGHLREDANVRREKLHDSDQRGNQAWGKRGVCISQMRSFPVTLYSGNKHDSNVAVLLPVDQLQVAAVWCYCSSPDFHQAVRAIDQKLNVTNATFVKVPFDLDYWQKVADEKYPDGLPEPHSDDPTQWLFQGDIPSSTSPLHVAMARLLGYEWPDQVDDGLGQHIDSDGIVTLTPVVNQEGVANRLRSLLQSAYDSPAPARAKGAPEVTEPRAWDESTLPNLLAQAGFAGMSLDEWLRDNFFESHCKLFHQRPFIWHIWDGRKDGFHAFVNYHKFGRQNLERLTHVYLGEWIERQRNAAEAGDATAEGRLAAAQALQKKLELIRIGEKPFDIFVRWKSLAEQPIGWEPDLNDGVRMNIRPFVEASILRGKVNVKWTKDRGKDPKPNVSGTVERHNDLHFSLAEKRAAREEV